MNRLHALFATAFSVIFAAACSGNVDISAPNTNSSAGGGDSGGKGSAGGGDSGGKGSAGGGDSGGSGNPPCEARSQSGGLSDYTPKIERFECALPDPCGQAHYTSNLYPGEPGRFLDVSVAKCILQKLRDREPVLLQYATTDSGTNSDQVTIFILDKEHAAMNGDYYRDLAGVKITRYHELLKPPAYFDDCLKLAEDEKLFECIASWSDGCAADVTLTCPGQ